MTEARTIVVCGRCGTFWDLADGQAGCVDTAHEHQRHEIHRHRSPVDLPDGSTITAVSFDDGDPYTRDTAPDFGLYLDARWQPPWPHVILDWPDFGVPDDPAVVIDALSALLERARAGQRVEIGCLGGHGRTGTAIACLAVLCGHPPGGAVEWVRSAYCDHAVETEDQVAFVRDLGDRGSG